MPSWKKLVVSGSDATLNSLQVTTNVTAAAFSGSFSGSFEGDGSGLTNLTVEIAEIASFPQTFTNTSSVVVNHDLDTSYPLVQVYNGDDEQIIPLRIKILSANSVQVNFSSNQSGYVIVAKGGHIISGTAANALLLEGQPGSYYLDYNNFTNVPAGIVSGSDQLTGSFDQRYVLSGSITQTTWDNIANKPPGIVSSSAQIATDISGSFTSVSQSIALDIQNLVTDSGSFSTRVTNLENFSASLDANFVSESEFALASGSFLVTGSVLNDTITLTKGDGTTFNLIVDNVQNATSASFALTASYLEGYISPFPYTGSAIITGSLEVIGGTVSGSFVGDGSGLTGIVATIESQTSLASTFTSQTTVTVNHALSTLYPLVQVYNGDDEQIIPLRIKILSANSVQVDFSSNQTGYVIIAKGGHIVSGTIILTDISEQTTVASTFTSVTSSTVVHNLNTAYPLVQVYNTLDEQVIPQTIKVLNSSSVQVNFPTPQSGYVVVAKAGHIISGSNQNALLLENEPGSYYLNYNNFTNIPAGLVSGSTQLNNSTLSGMTISGSFSGSYQGDGSQLTGVGAFPFTGSAGISGSLTVNGTITATTIVETSSERFKENIQTLEQNLSKVLELRPVTFNRIGSDKQEIGFIAEEIEEIYPETVVYDDSGRISGIEYTRLTAPLTKAIQDLAEMIRLQEEKIQDLTRKLDEKL